MREKCPESRPSTATHECKALCASCALQLEQTPFPRLVLPQRPPKTSPSDKEALDLFFTVSLNLQAAWLQRLELIDSAINPEPARATVDDWRMAGYAEALELVTDSFGGALASFARWLSADVTRTGDMTGTARRA